MRGIPTNIQGAQLLSGYADIVREPLPFPDAHFSLVTFSEVLEHLQ